MSTLPDEADLINNLAYVRRLYTDVLDWYRSADSKAQIIITLDGLFITFVTTAFFEQKDMQLTRMPWYTLALLGLMIVSLAFSLYYALSVLRSRIYTPRELTEFLHQAGVERADYRTYQPCVSWFFQIVSALDKEQFEKLMREIKPGFEVDAMSSQIYLLSANVSKKHGYVNYGFALAAITFMLFLLSGVSLLFS